MALINCPECNKQVSDKAEVCIHCGFPLCEYVNEQAMKEEEVVEIKQEFPQLPVLVANFDKDYMITYDNGNIRISQDDDILYDGDIRNIEIHGVKKSFLDFGRIELLVLKSKIPSELHCKDDASYEVCKIIKDDFDLRTKEKREAAERRIQERAQVESLIRQNRICPDCHSSNIDMQSRTYGAREEKTKTSYNMNLNPLKPFTVLNKKEKVVRRASSGLLVIKYICLDCGKKWMV